MHLSAVSRVICLRVGLLAPVFLSSPTPAAPIALADTPLFLGGHLAPNLVLTLDDSLSMPWAYVPDDIAAEANTRRFKSAYFNALYYDPAITYTPPPKYNGNTCTLDASNPATCYPNVSFTAAPINGFDATRGHTQGASTACNPAGGTHNYSPVDLGTNYAATQAYNPSQNSQTCTAGNGVAYSSTCTVSFQALSGDYRITVDPACGGPFTADSMRTGTLLTVSGAILSGNNKTYTVAVKENGNQVRVSTPVTSSASNPNVTLSWTGGPYPAYYYLFYTQAGAARPAFCTSTVAAQKDDDDCYVQRVVGSAEDTYSGTPAQKRQNFANWYSYYRTRNLATVSGAMRALSGLEDNVRVTWQALSTCNDFGGTNCRGWDNQNTDNRIRRLNAPVGSKTHKQDLYDWLSRFPTAGSTYLLKAADRAGAYFRGTIGINHPFADDPQIRDKPLAPDGTERSYDACRRNFHLLMTDGGWCGDTGSYAVSVGDANSSSVTLPEAMPTSGGGNTTNWTPVAPYRDGQGNNLADIAFRDWATDLQGGASGLPNNVPEIYKDRTGNAATQWLNPKNDPAKWQHLNTFTIGLGLSTTMNGIPVSGTGSYTAWGGSTFAGDYAKLALGTSCPTSTTGSTPASNYCWPYTQIGESCPPSTLNQQRKVYDLWHAAISGRGQFFSADSAQNIVDSFNAIVKQVAATTSASAALSTNSTSINTGTLLYQARFDTRDWHGQLIAYPVQGDGSVANPTWDASTRIPSEASRNIFTWNGSAGRSFTDCATALSASQKTALDTDASGVVDHRCADRLAWLRGNTSKENRFAGGIFRSRKVSVLGDIINSDPVFAHAEDYGYRTSGLAEKISYASFLSGKSSRPPVVYVGANDGLLHAFRADTGDPDSGKELFAYVPAGVYGNLSKLTDPGYTHRYFVDGSPSVGDAYLSGTWRTVLVAGLGGGGKSIYALDINDPGSFTQSNILWEYSDAADLGYTYSQPQIARLNDGQWAAIFGNGYNSASERAYLYVVRLSDGALIKKIAAGGSTSNGLSTPVLYDANNDKIADYVYAGDLQGNLWKFDLQSGSSVSWALANGGSPLFAAADAGSHMQPITAPPVIGAHPSGGILIYFGTGRYLASTDSSDHQVQSFYAIWDNGASGTVTRGELQAHTIVAETTEFTFNQRETSKENVDWGSQRGWYMDLWPPAGAAGERIIFRALLKHDRIIFVTLIPSTDPCRSGGDSWLMELDMVTGSSTAISAFDFNGDRNFDASDLLISGNASSGIKSTVGIVNTPTWLSSETPGLAFKELSGTTGNIMTIGNRAPIPTSVPERKYWIQIL